jgi:hypothetical protein
MTQGAGSICTDKDQCAGNGCCSGGCVDVSNDPSNCGTCGNSCGTANCVGGMCTGAVVLVTGESSPVGLSQDTLNLYWADAAGSIMTVAKAGGTATPIVANQQSAAITGTDGSTLYWITNVANTGKLAYADGDVAISLVTGLNGPSVLAVGSTNNIYWAEAGGLFFAPKGTGARTRVSTSSTVLNIYLDSANAYWFDRGASLVASAPLGTTSAGTLTSGIADIRGLSGFGSLLYLARTSEIQSLPTGGGTPTTLVSNVAPYSLAVDATGLYWASLTGGTIQTTPLAGGNAVTLVSNQSSPDFVLVDSTSVYWIAGSSIMKVAK